MRLNSMDKYVVVVMPAYNAASTLEKTYKDIPKGSFNEVLVVDDASSDNTARVANKLKLKTIVHKKNLGYGANQKTCYKTALKIGADIIVMLHPDYQYDPKLLPLLIEPIKRDYFDIMLGSRMQTREGALKGGMPLWKYISNRFLTFAENVVLGLSLSEYHTGYRAYSREALEKIPFETFSNDFVFDQQLLISARAHNLRIGEIAVPTKYFKEASSINFKRSLEYGSAILYELTLFLRGKYNQSKNKF